jgi:hypothetical protein
MNTAALQQEALRQQTLLRALWADDRAALGADWLRDAPERAARGLQAYRVNAGVLAERALGAAFPTLAQLVGDESFAALARAFWAADAPQRGDLAEWGGGLPGFIANAAQLADEPYLADVARLDWAVHRAERAANRSAVPLPLQRLADCDAAALWLWPAPGLALVGSAHPVATICQAHRSQAADRFAPVRAAFAAGRGEQALVWRDGFKAAVLALPKADARFMQALLQGRSLGAALDAAGDGFAFEAWLLQAVQQGWLQTIEDHPPPVADA